MLSAEPHRGNREGTAEESYGRFLYNRHRYYSPELGRYLNADPIGQLGILAREDVSLAAVGAGVVGGDSNSFAYAFSSPVAWMDPSGLAGKGSPIPDTPYRGVIERDPTGRPHIHVIDKKGKRIGTEGLGGEPHDGQTLDDSRIPNKYKGPIRKWAEDKVKKQEDAKPQNQERRMLCPLPPPHPALVPVIGGSLILGGTVACLSGIGCPIGAPAVAAGAGLLLLPPGLPSSPLDSVGLDPNQGGL